MVVLPPLLWEQAQCPALVEIAPQLGFHPVLSLAERLKKLAAVELAAFGAVGVVVQGVFLAYAHCFRLMLTKDYQGAQTFQASLRELTKRLYVTGQAFASYMILQNVAIGQHASSP